MLPIAKVKLYGKVDVEDLKYNLSDSSHLSKSLILKYLKKDKFISSCTTEKVFDFIKKEETNIPMVSYHDDQYYWDDRHIYYFEKYNLKLNDDFVQHVLSQKI